MEEPAGYGPDCALVTYGGRFFRIGRHPQRGWGPAILAVPLLNPSVATGVGDQRDVRHPQFWRDASCLCGQSLLRFAQLLLHRLCGRASIGFTGGDGCLNVQDFEGLSIQLWRKALQRRGIQVLKS